ncbi:MAG: NTPase [Armatimonadota bacterium]|nr:NTPase [Armatimonadota bacterium]MDR7448411.1 NTPase [Armatimonadota bacterium]MDR7459578.1 NTPase [Armatimonadota bacterium]MDR7480335.1 NTPase [Armatimonadota bacterium]MDR7488318.1 NTPase [Armatimonadota bacterium]
MAEIFLITGRPGVGKTTLIRRLAEWLGPRAGGFYTDEVRHGGTRVGFRLTTLDGRSAVFAHVDFAGRSPHRVGRYGVDLAVLEEIGVAAIRHAASRGQIVVVDEIGKMELLSAAFRQALEEVARGSAPLLATITAVPHPWADAFKRHPRTVIHVLTPANRDRVEEAVRTWVGALPARPAGRARARRP